MSIILKSQLVPICRGTQKNESLNYQISSCEIYSIIHDKFFKSKKNSKHISRVLYQINGIYHFSRITVTCNLKQPTPLNYINNKASSFAPKN